MDNKLCELIKRAQGTRSQNEFAMHCNINSSTFTNLRQGKYNPSAKLLGKIAAKAKMTLLTKC